MGKKIDTTYNPTSYELLTQTPKNFSKKNYFIDTLQEKIWADWEYRPNRVDVEQERTIGEEDYFPLEVVIQNIKNDTGEKVSDDYKRLVFKQIDYRVRLGTKFRFSFNFDLEEPNEEKFVWLATNKDSTIPTAGVVVSRCNGTLGSIWVDDSGKASYHYEPVICTTNLQSVGLKYDDVIISPQSQVVLIVQHNKYTQQYYLNQRFIIGYNKVYKVKGINSFNSLKTYDPYDVGTIMIYAEVDEASVKDNFEARIAFNKESDPIPESSNSTQPTLLVEGNYVFKRVTPQEVPQELFSTPIQFEYDLFVGDERIAIPVEVEATLGTATNANSYYEITNVSDNVFAVRRLKLYNRSPLVLKFFIPADQSPTGEEFSAEVSLSLRGLE